MINVKTIFIYAAECLAARAIEIDTILSDSKIIWNGQVRWNIY